MQEMELVKQARNGSKDSMQKLIQQNYSILKGYLLKVTSDPELAADLTQETMLKAILKIKKFKGKSKFSSWLISIGTNLYRDYIKKHKRELHVEDLNDYDSISEIKDEKVVIEEILDKLPSEKRMVLVLKHYFGYKYKEISEIMDCPVGTVKSRMYYCLDFIRDNYKGGKN